MVVRQGNCLLASFFTVNRNAHLGAHVLLADVFLRHGDVMDGFPMAPVDLE